MNRISSDMMIIICGWPWCAVEAFFRLSPVLLATLEAVRLSESLSVLPLRPGMEDFYQPQTYGEDMCSLKKEPKRYIAKGRSHYHDQANF